MSTNTVHPRPTAGYYTHPIARPDEQVQPHTRRRRPGAHVATEHRAQASYLNLRLGIMLVIMSLVLILIGVNVWAVFNLVNSGDTY